jgi:hypothetical protein
MTDLISHIKDINKVYNKTDMDFLAFEYDVICKVCILGHAF